MQAPRILVVEDHPSTRTLISILLQQIGYDEIRLVPNGLEALEQLKRDKYDLILSDWDMPEMDGLTLWDKMREDDTLKNIPFVLLTAIKETEMVKTAISKGVTDYIVKPFTLEALATKVAGALTRNRKS